MAFFMMSAMKYRLVRSCGTGGNVIRFLVPLTASKR